MLNRLILKVTKFQLPPPNRLGTVGKNILGGHHAPPCQIGLKRTLLVDLVSFSTDTMNPIKHLFQTIQINHTRESLVMMQILFIFGP